MQVNVKALTGQYAITAEDGNRVFSTLESALDSAEADIVLDFDGVEVFASPFFNAAIGQLLAKHDVSDLKALRYERQKLVERVVRNSMDYYRKPAVRTAIDAIVREHAQAAE